MPLLWHACLLLLLVCPAGGQEGLTNQDLVLALKETTAALAAATNSTSALTLSADAATVQLRRSTETLGDSVDRIIPVINRFSLVMEESTGMIKDSLHAMSADVNSTVQIAIAGVDQTRLSFVADVDRAIRDGGKEADRIVNSTIEGGLSVVSSLRSDVDSVLQDALNGTQMLVEDLLGGAQVNGLAMQVNAIAYSLIGAMVVMPIILCLFKMRIASNQRQFTAEGAKQEAIMNNWRIGISTPRPRASFVQEFV